MFSTHTADFILVTICEFTTKQVCLKAHHHDRPCMLAPPIKGPTWSLGLVKQRSSVSVSNGQLNNLTSSTRTVEVKILAYHYTLCSDVQDDFLFFLNYAYTYIYIQYQ